VEEDTVTAADVDQREILVGELGARAVRVPVPDPHGPAHQIEPAEPLAAAVEVIFGIEQQGVDDTPNTTRRIVREALDLEARARTESVAGEIRVILHLMGQEPAVGRPEPDLPRIQA